MDRRYGPSRPPRAALHSPNRESRIDRVAGHLAFAGDPTHPNVYEFYDRKRRQCAEVLVPDCIPPEYITGAYVSCEESRDECEDLDVPWSLTVDPDKFFQT